MRGCRYYFWSLEENRTSEEDFLDKIYGEKNVHVDFRRGENHGLSKRI